MAIIQADIIDIKTDTPQQSDIFFVDTNIWFWQTYTNAAFTAKRYQITDYPNYINKTRQNGATLTYSGLTLAELAHIIEKTEYDIYVQSNGYLHFKKYRHDYPTERANVVAEVQFTWRRIKKIAIPIDLTVDDATTDAAINRFTTQAVDGYDLLMLEAISKAGAGTVKIITDDMDYSVVPGIQVFTSNKYVIQDAAMQKKLVRR
ncbi:MULTISPECIES: hypothetical protein [Nostocales]|jgi:hypothetical protein|uniref:Uncharacterized protein n=1 Tax=Dolichospermum flos-aquae UHCC 0037 TaxID=2590026 RepID=A0ACC7S497_DOLFA|nr:MULTISPECIES: hypothetical protein [Nostocales]MBO1069357.1 hypothetical protein [Dolichospermum sp. DEX189]ALB42513.1 hypothetical protein AA650_20485 [Anabaena sp. WA102]MBO1064434.1 hypothetical protein [Anabaena sp. 54]MTJ17593.1 hypothetical protein [Dolichospermum sp. UHCC 0299]MTJ38304.1 hypothetical protein [Dolichospermum sp. UHCC 0406]